MKPHLVLPHPADRTACPVAPVGCYAARMQLTDDDIREFSEIWQQEFGEDIPLGEARSRASHLMHLYLLFSRPAPPVPPPDNQQPP